MAIGHWATQFSRTDTGLPAVGTVITVKNTGTNVGATLTDSSGTSLGVSTFLTDSRGNGGFYASDILGYDIYQGSLLVVSDVRVTDIGGGSFPGTYPLVNADIAAGAAIAESKIANLTTDLAAIGTYFKQAVQAATTVALPANTSTSGVLTATVNGTFPTVDGYTALVDDRLLVKNEATGANNGIYTVTNLGSASTKWVLTRATDGDGGAELNGGASVIVLNGTTQTGQQWTQTTKLVTIGTTAQTWTQTTSAGNARRPPHYIVAAADANPLWKAQADYICTGTNDHVKIQDALNAAGNFGGVVELSDTFTSFNLAGTLTIPPYVDLVGQLGGSTQMHWSELGSGQFAVKTDGSTGVGRNHLRNMRFAGPSTTSAPGGHPATMNGVQLANNTVMEDVQVVGFNSGVVVWGNHQTLARCNVGGNYYNIDYADGPPAQGNQSFIACDLTGPTYASIHIAGTAEMSALFLNCPLGFGPYGIVRDDGAALAGGPAVNGSTLIDTVVEAAGNAAIWDKSANTTPQPFMIDSFWSAVGFSWNTATYKIAGEAQDYAVKTMGATGGDFAGTIMRQGGSPFLAGTTGIFNQALAAAQLQTVFSPNRFDAGHAYKGSGAPLSALGNNGDYYLRTDTPAIIGQRIYVKSAGAWTPYLSGALVTTYAPTTTATKSTTSTTDAALDTTNLRVASVIAPTTGNLVVHVTLGKVTTGTGGGMFCIFANGARVGPHVFIPASVTVQNVPMLIELTGLTAGTSYNIDLASHSVTSGQTTSLVIDDATTSTNTAGPTVIRVDPAT